MDSYGTPLVHLFGISRCPEISADVCNSLEDNHIHNSFAGVSSNYLKIDLDLARLYLKIIHRYLQINMERV